MTRIYAWAFAAKAELDDHVARWEEAQRRDHKKLGRELGIFAIDNDVGRGLPLWLPNGTVIRDELEKLAKELEFKAGYQRVATPHLARESLYFKSGHLPYYAEDMYPSMEVMDQGHAEAGEGGGRGQGRLPPAAHELPAPPQGVSPPCHAATGTCPVRLTEYGQVYRWEDSGAVGGLVRVRGMCMNDCAHLLHRGAGQGRVQGR